MNKVKIYAEGPCTDPFWMGMCVELKTIIPDSVVRKVSHTLEGTIDPPLRELIRDVEDHL